MNNFLNRTKIKYIIGAEKDLPGYPSVEDLFYLIEKYWYEDNGKSKITKYKFMEDIDLTEDKIIFNKDFLSEYLSEEFEDKINNFIEKQIENKTFKIIRQTKKDTFYEWCRYS